MTYSSRRVTTSLIWTYWHSAPLRKLSFHHKQINPVFAVLQHFLLKQQTVPACHCGEQRRNSRWITLNGIQEDAVMVYSCVSDKRNPEGLVPLLWCNSTWITCSSNLLLSTSSSLLIKVLVLRKLFVTTGLERMTSLRHSWRVYFLFSMWLIMNVGRVSHCILALRRWKYFHILAKSFKGKTFRVSLRR